VNAAGVAEGNAARHHESGKEVYEKVQCGVHKLLDISGSVGDLFQKWLHHPIFTLGTVSQGVTQPAHGWHMVDEMPTSNT